MAEVNNLETDMSSQQKAELDKEKSKEEKKDSKRAKKQHYRELNEPPKLTVLEEVGNAVTHGIGAGLAIAGFVLLLLKSDTGLKVMASCFYGISLILMFLMSCLYHSYKSGLAVKRLWRRFDYSSIYLLIGGTFAPLHLAVLGKCAWNSVVLCAVGTYHSGDRHPYVCSDRAGSDRYTIRCTSLSDGVLSCSFRAGSEMTSRFWDGSWAEVLSIRSA